MRVQERQRAPLVGSETDEGNPMQDLFENYVGDLRKIREVFNSELTASAKELSKAMSIYARDSEAALALFMEKVSTRGVELEAAAAARLDQFRGLPANGGLSGTDVAPHRPAQTPTKADQSSVAAAAERAVADSLHVENDGDGQPRPSQITLVKSGRPLEPRRA
jgi:hypothetical protein